MPEAGRFEIEGGSVMFPWMVDSPLLFWLLPGLLEIADEPLPIRGFFRRSALVYGLPLVLADVTV